MYCKNCGAELEDSVAFCTRCGIRIEKEPAQPAVYAESAAQPAEEAIPAPAEESFARPETAPPPAGFPEGAAPPPTAGFPEGAVPPPPMPRPENIAPPPVSRPEFAPPPQYQAARKEKVNFGTGALVLCLIVIALLSVSTGVFAGLYFSLR